MARDPNATPGRPVSGSEGPRDRRGAHRAAIQIPAVLQLGTRDVDCKIRDLSSRGIGLTVRESLAPGMVVRVVFRLPNARQPVEITGVLARSEGGRGGGALGLVFVEPDVESVRAIETFVARNRSDQAFSGGRRARDGAPGAGLDDLYKRAVSEIEEKPRKGGRFRRWRLRRGE